jgi:hypothetical protein
MPKNENRFWYHPGKENSHMSTVLRSLLALLFEICQIMFYQQDIPQHHKEDLGAALSAFDKAVQFYEKRERKA